MRSRGLDLVSNAYQEHTAVAAFNIYNIEALSAALEACRLTLTPIILQLTVPAFDWWQRSGIGHLLAEAADAAPVKVGLQLDHVRDLEHVASAVGCGFTSVMVDGSHLNFEENVSLISRCAELAHRADVAIEAELGATAGNEDFLSDDAQDHQSLTDPEQAAAFVDATKVDALAVAFGTVHGRYAGEPRLDLVRLETINAGLAIPLVMHGASGLSDDQLLACRERGIAKVNLNTELRQIYFGTAASFVSDARGDLLGMMQATSSAMRDAMVAKIRLLSGPPYASRERG